MTHSKKKDKKASTLKLPIVTRSSIQIKREKRRLQQQKRRQGPIVRKKKIESQREYRQKKKFEELSNLSHIDTLNQKSKRLEAKIEQLELEIKAYEEKIEEVFSPDSFDSQCQEDQDQSSWVDSLTSFVTRNKDDNKISHRLIGLDVCDFKKLVSDYEGYFSDLTWRSTPKMRKIKQTSLTAEVALWITLYWMRQYPTGISLQITTGVHERTLARIFLRVMTALDIICLQELKWPEDDELREWIGHIEKSGPLERIVCYADGTVLHGPRSLLKFAPGSHDPFFSGHKHKHGVNIVCIVNPNGKILWSSDWEPGKTTDQSISNKNELRLTFEGKDYGIAADGGFSFNKKDEPRKIIAAKPFRQKEIKQSDKVSKKKRDFNKKLSSNRVIVENVFGRLKSWRIIGGFMRHFHPNVETKPNFFDLNLIFKILCTLHNRDILTHPM